MLPRWAQNIIRIPLGLYIGLVLFCIVCFASWHTFFGRLDISNWNPLFAVVALLLGGASCIAVSRSGDSTKDEQRIPKKHFLLITLVGSMLLLVCELFIVHGCGFMTGWDAGMVTRFSDYDRSYYSAYPNQLFIAGVFLEISHIAALLGIMDGYTMCVVIGCVQVSLAVFLITQVANRIGGYKVGYAVFALSIALIGLSPWILVPYSDTYAIFWVTFVLFCYVCVNNTPLKWSAIAFSAVIGYAIKPTVVFIVLSVVVIEVIRVMNERWMMKRNKAERSNSGLDEEIGQTRKTMSARERICNAAFVLLLVGVAVFLSSSVVSLTKDFGLEIDESKALSPSHYLMMGFNAETGGAYSETDVLYSLDQPADKRQQVNLKEWSDRVDHLGFVGTTSFLLKKSLSNYADGTFAWEGEGAFYQKVIGQNEQLKAFYGIGEGRENLFAPIDQTLWLAILIGFVAFCFFQKEANTCECAVLLSLLMLSVFLLLFECRARYLFLYVPLYVLIGVLGWRAWASRLKRRLPRIFSHNV